MPGPRKSRKSTLKAAPGGVNIDTVAEAAGVSAATVSRILNATAAVSAAKKQAVADAIARLGFVPNPVARGLARGRTLSIGVVTQSIDSPFYGDALRGIEDELASSDYSPLFVSGHWDAQTEGRCIETLRARRVDGLIVFTGRSSDAALRTCAKALPVVVVGRSLKAPGLFALNFDNFEGGRLATEHLIGLGHRRIAFIGGDPGHPDAAERQRGYAAALQAAGIACEPGLVVAGRYHEESGLQAVEQLLRSRQRFSAVFAANDQMAVGAALGLHRLGLAVPADVSLIGFDDLVSSAFSIPPLTTVHYPGLKLGRLAALSMLQLLRGARPAAAIPAPRIVVRESTRLLAA
ncbi:MAG: LacI family DNA-binding transcriptional regulator [Burkholderiales bacterium]|nr:LacI family DNA-binding transcriptional regulator [Burkholderiales bacterium]MDE2393943.1 LacI family DNA-binding transcriptional regulator [Burkholderiales bacterium]MDE2456398.1 LacI family DNA-binding transcriptional regulator [Burkholderiales bacterium]